MRGDGLAHAGAGAVDDIDDALRDVEPVEQFDEGGGVEGGLLARLDHDGISGDERRAELAGDQEERKVPRQDRTDDADGLAEQEDVFARPVALDDLALDPARPLGHVVEVIGGEGDLDLREAEELALLLRDDPRDRLDPLADPRRDGAQGVAALDRRQAAPGDLGRLGGGDRLVHGLT